MRKTLAIVFVILAFASSAYAMVLAGVLSSYRAPQAPNAPTGVTATAGDTQNTVNWTAPAVDGTHDAATSYTLYGGTSASPTTSIYTGSGTSYTHTGLTNDTPYYYRLTASNPGGTSGYSSPDATATPSVTWTDTFTGTAFNSRWTTGTSGDGTWTWNSPGVTASSSGRAAGSAARIYVPLDKTTTSQYQVQVQITSALNTAICDQELMFGTVSGLPVIGTNASRSANRGMTSTIYSDGSSVTIQPQYNSTTGWKGLASNNTWGTLGTFSATVNTTYTMVWDITTTTVQLTIKNGATVIAQTPATTWASFTNNGSYPYLAIGDFDTDLYFPAFKVVSVARTL